MQNYKHAKIQKHAEMQQSENGAKYKNDSDRVVHFFPLRGGLVVVGQLEGRHRNSRQMQPDALDDDDDDDDDDDGVDLNIVIGVKDGITDRINMWQWC